ncbi:MAG: nitrilase-related carbon-nitrogen hydrolase [Rhodospirillaceae bacterium]|nr:nitrilase-related carbon-nitrogen hydrolase [Rhodospirillaceae bacterium]
MIVVQAPWTARDGSTVSAVLDEARRTLVDDGPALALLPHADGREQDAPAEAEATALLARLARDHALYLCASSYVRCAGEPAPRTVGYLHGPDGTQLLRAPKVLPDLVEGFTDTIADTFAPAAFKIASTPLGQIAVVCGEDVLYPQLVRGLTTAGAEIFLNPSRERRDQTFESRMAARQARAYENIAYVATASASSLARGNVSVKLPPASMVAEWWGTKVASGGEESFFTVDLDLQNLRRRRQEPMGNFPVIVRMPLYGPGYAAHAGPKRASPATREAWIAQAKTRVAATVKVPSAPAPIDRYEVALCQCISHGSNKPEQLLDNRWRNLEAALDLVGWVARSPAVKLVVFPEFFLTGAASPLGSRSSHIAHLIGISFPGREADRLAQFAQETKSYVAGGVFEFDPAWPGRFFNSAFIFDDNGNLVHLYRKIHCADVFGTLPDTTPGSVYDQYVQKYGYEHLFPVVDTPIGRLATKICFDMNFPETARGFATRGAEVIIHPTSEPHNIRRRAWDIGRHTRAYENSAYVITCGHGGEVRSYSQRQQLTFMNRGYSKVVNFDGTLQVVADGPGALPLQGSIDLKALRDARRNLKSNLLAWDDPVVYQAAYNAGRGLPNNLWADDPAVNPYEKMQQLRSTIAVYNRAGIYVPPIDGAANANLDNSRGAAMA